MPIYDGVVTLAQADIPVLVELEDGHVRLSASGREIGQWRTDECEIVQVEDGAYAINAENETLHFVPNQPTLFGAAVDEGRRRQERARAHPPGPVDEPAPDTETAPETETEQAAPADEPAETERDAVLVAEDGIAEAPPPRTLTLALFYALCALTAVMGVWAIVEMIL
jgi:hypothetical protein